MSVRPALAADMDAIKSIVAATEFAQTCAFYVKQGYAEEACIGEFYEAGADKIVFWKKLGSQT